VNLDRRARDGEGSLSESERDELNRLRKKNAEFAMERDVQFELLSRHHLAIREQARRAVAAEPIFIPHERPRQGPSQVTGDCHGDGSASCADQ
jgi:hypothetical protein